MRFIINYSFTLLLLFQVNCIKGQDSLSKGSLHSFAEFRVISKYTKSIINKKNIEVNAIINNDTININSKSDLNFFVGRGFDSIKFVVFDKIDNSTLLTQCVSKSKFKFGFKLWFGKIDDYAKLRSKLLMDDNFETFLINNSNLIHISNVLKSESVFKQFQVDKKKNKNIKNALFFHIIYLNPGTNRVKTTISFN